MMNWARSRNGVPSIYVNNRRVADVQARVARANKPKPKVYVELGKDGPGVFGASFADDQWGPLVETAGGVNIAKGKITAEAPLSAEYVLSANPDFVFIAGSNWTSAPSSDSMKMSTIDQRPIQLTM
mgnify:CR=1 FL=1